MAIKGRPIKPSSYGYTGKQFIEEYIDLFDSDQDEFFRKLISKGERVSSEVRVYFERAGIDYTTAAMNILISYLENRLLICRKMLGYTIKNNYGLEISTTAFVEYYVGEALGFDRIELAEIILKNADKWKKLNINIIGNNIYDTQLIFNKI